MKRAPLKSLSFMWLAFAFSACTGSLLETKLPVPTVYVLSAATPSTPPEATDSTVDLAVSLPTATPGLDTERIAVLKEARLLDYYREAQWGATVPLVAQALIVGTLQNHKLFRSVTTEQSRVTTNYLLDLEIRDFQAEYTTDANPTVHVTFVGSLIRIKDRKLLGVYPASMNVPAGDNRLGPVVEAFESAARQATLSLGKQAATAIAAHRAD